MKSLVQLRRDLHQSAELSGQESKTAQIIADELNNASCHRILQGIGGHGVIGVFAGDPQRPTVLLRCELDALPIAESQDKPHASRRPGCSHQCGHDGHMAIMIGVARILAESNDFKRTPGISPQTWAWSCK